MSNVTVIGKNSFLARALQRNKDTKDWLFIDHTEALSETDWINKTDILINCAYHPDLMRGEYSPVKDIDFLLSGYIAGKDIHYIMLSSRAAYGPAPDDLYLREDMTAAPDAPYGVNKLHTEETLRQMIAPEKLTILRSANIFGNEYGRGTFFGMMLTNLKDKGILEFNIAPDARRDFLSVQQWADDLVQIASAPKGGLYNLGAGFGVSTQDMADMLISANGSGEVKYTDSSYNGQFILDTAKTKDAFSIKDYTASDLELDVKALFS